MKKKILLFLALILFSSMTVNVSAVDYNFAQNENYYSSLCSSAAAANNVTACTAYQAYVNQKVINAENDLKNLQNDMKNLSANITTMANKIAGYEAQITQLEKDITNLQKSIKSSEKAILDLGIEITDRTKNIDEIDQTIMNRMVKMQAFVSLNSYIDFMMGAKDFSDLVLRIQGINDITEYDKTQINLLIEQVNALNAAKSEVERQKTAQVQNMANLKVTQSTVTQLKVGVATIITEYRKQQQILEAKEAQVAGDLAATAAILKGVSEALKNVPTSSGFIRPVSSFYVSAGVWFYSDGNVHLAADMAAGVGTPLKAVANGVVIYSSNACPTYGSFTSSCGYPGRSYGGNQVYLMVSVNNVTYAIVYMHLAQNTAIPVGTIVDAGEIVGKIGSSGGSTGPHVHVEVIYLGNNNVGYYANSWNGDLYFGVYVGTTALNYRCDYNGHRAPCRENPLTIFNIAVGRSY